MWEIGFEPTKALSHRILSPAPLTARELPPNFVNIWEFKKIYKCIILGYIEDDHNSLETPVPIPNTEVKLTMFLALVSEMKRNL